MYMTSKTNSRIQQVNIVRQRVLRIISTRLLSELVTSWRHHKGTKKSTFSFTQPWLYRVRPAAYYMTSIGLEARCQSFLPKVIVAEKPSHSINIWVIVKKSDTIVSSESETSYEHIFSWLVRVLTNLVSLSILCILMLACPTSRAG